MTSRALLCVSIHDSRSPIPDWSGRFVQATNGNRIQTEDVND